MNRKWFKGNLLNIIQVVQTEKCGLGVAVVALNIEFRGIL